MRYLVKAKVKPDKEKLLLDAMESVRLDQGSVAGISVSYRDSNPSALSVQTGLLRA